MSKFVHKSLEAAGIFTHLTPCVLLDYILITQQHSVYASKTRVYTPGKTYAFFVIFMKMSNILLFSIFN